ncbi:mRNA-capping enzyme subunit alpha-like isoform X6 [Nicotiana tomentosiformis]|uniref:mRNA-capping enzyme subunit alpha-like isoform X6 n=1 Tax=Nicotiana tomentosiformis TaxID=4098 RepID=UPI00051B27D2|nr:mRNA-capping enzyme-like isoform X6 [Nicotiana tomentosiformis]
MDLNALPHPEDDEEIFGQQLEDEPEEFIVKHSHEHADYVASAVEISRREREERIQRLKRHRPDDRPTYPSQPRMRDEIYLTKTQKPSSRLPPGWLDCPAFGREIGRIIPSKVPLDETFNDCVLPGKRYSLRQVLHQQKVLGRKLGMVIDLTNTTRYYSSSDWRKEGIKHVKIPCKGRDAVPDNESCHLFVYEDNRETQISLSNDDILGDAVPQDQQDDLRQFCYQALKMTPRGRGTHFPGSHPVSLNRDNLQLLRQRYYYATWKADGTRYMMLITMGGCFLIDRHFNFRRVQMRFPCTHTDEGVAKRVHHFTLLDGEMVIDTLPGTQKQERRYLIYDMMALNGVSIVEQPFCERWRMIDKEVIGPRNHERQHICQSGNPYYRYECEPFRMRRKNFWLLSTVRKVLKELIPELSHEADGLIFQGWLDPYVPLTHHGLLKWKYPEMNSVDFLFEVVDGRELLYLHERGKKKLMEGNRVVFPDSSDPSDYLGKIIECSWDSNNQEWVWMRTRIDKGTPNDYNTYRKVLRSITDNITEEVLLNEISEIILLPIYVEGIQNDSKAHHHSGLVRRR